MDEYYEQAIHQAASLAFHLAAIENALCIAEDLNAFDYLSDTIRWHIQQAEAVAADDLARSRRILHGVFPR